MSHERAQLPNLTDAELQGFLQVLMKQRRGLEPTPEMLAFLEKASANEQVSDEEVYALARVSVARVLKKRLQSAQLPVRAFGTHLKAIRTWAKCSSVQIAAALGQDVRGYDQIESGSREPLDIAPRTLASLVDLFGLRFQDLRKALILHYEKSYLPSGLRFARGTQDNIGKDEVAIAAEDLKSAPEPKKPAHAEVVKRVDQRVDEVRGILEGEGER